MHGELIPTLVRARLHLESLVASNAVLWPGGLEDTLSAVQDLPPIDSQGSPDSSSGVRLAPLPSRPATERTNCHETGVLHVLHVESNGNSRRLVRTPTLYWGGRAQISDGYRPWPYAKLVSGDTGGRAWMHHPSLLHRGGLNN